MMGSNARGADTKADFDALGLQIGARLFELSSVSTCTRMLSRNSPDIAERIEALIGSMEALPSLLSSSHKQALAIEVSMVTVRCMFMTDPAPRACTRGVQNRQYVPAGP